MRNLDYLLVESVTLSGDNLDTTFNMRGKYGTLAYSWSGADATDAVLTLYAVCGSVDAVTLTDAITIGAATGEGLIAIETPLDGIRFTYTANANTEGTLLFEVLGED